MGDYMTNRMQVGDQVIRRWNGKKYYICHDVDNGSEFLISEKKGTRVKDCKVCENPINLKKVEILECSN